MKIVAGLIGAAVMFATVALAASMCMQWWMAGSFLGASVAVGWPLAFMLDDMESW